MFDNNCNTVPTRGFILPKWEQSGSYRATAHAYLKREGLFSVEHHNGRWYTLTQIEDAMIRG